MLDRSVIERMLKANGVETVASDEEIRSVLISAKWHDDDVDAAITVLRENTATHQTRVDSMHKIFRSDEKLKPETVSSLLGIDIDLPMHNETKPTKVRHDMSAGQVVQIALISMALALFFVLGAMWMMDFGLFYTDTY